MKRNQLKYSSVICVAVLLWGLADAFSSPSIKNADMKRSSTRRRRSILLELAADGDSKIDGVNGSVNSQAGKLEQLKQLEAELAAKLAMVRREKLATIRSRPLVIGLIGFGRFGQFIAKTFAKYGKVVATSRTDYTDIAESLGVKYVPLSNPEQFLAEGLDVIVVATSILSFESTIEILVPHLRNEIRKQQEKLQQRSSEVTFLSTPLHGPLIVDVLSVKEHARKIMLKLLPEECDILCTHPMFGPDSGKNGWYDLNLVYEKTRVDKVLLNPKASTARRDQAFVDDEGGVHSVHENSEAHVEGMDRMERFLSIWEEEGCRMVPLSCKEHDAYSANSQFITHLVGRVLGSQGLSQTPIDTNGFESVLNLIKSTTADSFDLFYGLYKYNENSAQTIKHLQAAMKDVVQKLQKEEKNEEMAEDKVVQQI